jgi:hypothetical protein
LGDTSTLLVGYLGTNPSLVVYQFYMLLVLNGRIVCRYDVPFLAQPRSKGILLLSDEFRML